jgi:Rap1a immunity proteins
MRQLLSLTALGGLILMGVVTSVTDGKATETTRELLKQCEELSKSGVLQDQKISLQGANAGKCWGYLSAYLDLSFWSKDGVSVNGLLVEVCLPNGFDAAQFVKMFIDYARKNSKTMNRSAPIALANMPMDNFRCKKER